MFRKFRELGSVRQVLLWLKQENIKLPATGRLPGETGVVWKSPVYNTFYHIRVNPTYAGAYARGKIWHFGLLANGHRAAKLSQCRDLLAVTATSTADTPTTETTDTEVPAHTVCPHCHGQMAFDAVVSATPEPAEIVGLDSP